MVKPELIKAAILYKKNIKRSGYCEYVFDDTTNKYKYRGLSSIELVTEPVETHLNRNN